MSAGAVLNFQVSTALGNGEISLNRGESVHFPCTTGSGGRKDRVGKGENGAGILCGTCPLPWIHADSRAGADTENGNTSTAQSWLLEFLKCVYFPSG